MELIFATNNPNKLREIRALVDSRYNILGLKDLNIAEEIPEDHQTIEENASQKAWYLYRKLGKNCFADDSGLEVKALEGAPGVYSARYSRIGDVTFPDMEPAAGNIRKLLLEMEGIQSREARFRTIISLVMGGKEHRFEGIVEGRITEVPRGMKGFGYDPVFVPQGYGQTFAEMALTLKNDISHRARAVHALVEFLGRA